MTTRFDMSTFKELWDLLDTIPSLHYIHFKNP